MKDDNSVLRVTRFVCALFWLPLVTMAATAVLLKSVDAVQGAALGSCYVTACHVPRLWEEAQAHWRKTPVKEKAKPYTATNPWGEE
jgi:hypothetical protein